MRLRENQREVTIPEPVTLPSSSSNTLDACSPLFKFPQFPKSTITASHINVISTKEEKRKGSLCTKKS